MSENQSESIIQAIRLTQKLRASVAKVFRNLADGCSVAKGNEKHILNEFHESLLNVNNDFRYFLLKLREKSKTAVSRFCHY